MLDNPYVNKIGKVVHVQPNDIRVQFADGYSDGFLEENLSFVSNTAPEEYRMEFEKLSKARQKMSLKNGSQKRTQKIILNIMLKLKLSQNLLQNYIMKCRRILKIGKEIQTNYLSGKKNSEIGRAHV